MKRFFLILFLLPYTSYCQIDSEFILQKPFFDQWSRYCISKMGCFDLTLDSTLAFSKNGINYYDDYYYLYYSYGSEYKQLIDSIDPAGIYGSMLYNFKNETDNSYVVLWKMEGEYNPFFNAYYISKRKIVKIGEWGMTVSNIEYYGEYCDYAIEDVRIHQRHNEIELSFLKNMNFIDLSKDIYNEDWALYKAGELIITFNIVDGALRLIERNE